MNDLKLDRDLQKGDKYGQVKLVQEWLCLHGDIISIDEDFGDATDEAVKNFQYKNGIAQTGIVDNNTFEKLVAPMKAALADIPAGGMPLGKLIVAYARQHLLQHPCEVGGENRGPWIRMYMDGNEGKQWLCCAGFVCFCLKQACKTLSQSLPIHPSFSVDELAASAKNNNIFEDHTKVTPQPKPGSFFLVRKTSSDWTHVGIVVDASPPTFKTIEGNTNDGGSSNGYEVSARIRGYNNKDFIVF